MGAANTPGYRGTAYVVFEKLPLERFGNRGLIFLLGGDVPVQAMEAAMTSDRAKAELYAKILYDQALLIAGLPLEDPSEYTDLVAELMK